MPGIFSAGHRQQTYPEPLKRMWRQYLVFSIVVLFLAIAGFTVNWFMPGRVLSNLSAVFLYAANIMAVNYLYRFGRFAYSRWRSVLFFLIAIGFIAALFRLQHWAGAAVLVTITMLGIPALYTAWFFKKKEKTNNDFLKLAWINVQFIAAWLEQLHIFSGGMVSVIISTALLQATYLHFWVQLRKKLSEHEKGWDFDRGMKP